MTHLTHLLLTNESTACGIRGLRYDMSTTTEWRKVFCESCRRTARYKALRSLEGVQNAAAWLAEKEGRTA